MKIESQLFQVDELVRLICEYSTIFAFWCDHPKISPTQLVVRRLQERLQKEFGLSETNINVFLFHPKFRVGGSFLLQVLLDEWWPESDLNVFVESDGFGTYKEPQPDINRSCFFPSGADCLGTALVDARTNKTRNPKIDSWKPDTKLCFYFPSASTTEFKDIYLNMGDIRITKIYDETVDFWISGHTFGKEESFGHRWCAPNQSSKFVCSLFFNNEIKTITFHAETNTDLCSFKPLPTYVSQGKLYRYSPKIWQKRIHVSIKQTDHDCKVVKWSDETAYLYYLALLYKSRGFQVLVPKKRAFKMDREIIITPFFRKMYILNIMWRTDLFRAKTRLWDKIRELILRCGFSKIKLDHMSVESLESFVALYDYP